MIAVVLPDTGPLISLARVDLLDRFNCQILITDAVKLELLEGPAHTPDQMPLAAWIAAGGNRIKVIETDWGSVLQENIALRQALSTERNLRIPPAGSGMQERMRSWSLRIQFVPH
ncbi:MAG: hypothetical protein OXF74_07670 [Rhodobacteraceae bacterium]|nr:hypothetical protein [Paracoccaceae bacterium]